METKIIIVDDSKSFRDVLRVVLSENFNYKIIEEAECGYDMLDSRLLHSADIILMDLMMPGMDGIETAKEILKKNRDLKIIAVTMHAEKAYLEELIEAGFKGCILKNNLFEEIDAGIHSVIWGGFYFPSELKVTTE